MYPTVFQEEIYYVETDNVTVSGTSGAPTTVFAGTSLRYTGGLYAFEFFGWLQSAAGDRLFVSLYQDGVDQGAFVGQQDSAGLHIGSVHGFRRYAPSAGAHTISVVAFRTSSNGFVYGVSAGVVPAFFRISRLIA